MDTDVLKWTGSVEEFNYSPLDFFPVTGWATSLFGKKFQTSDHGQIKASMGPSVVGKVWAFLMSICTLLTCLLLLCISHEATCSGQHKLTHLYCSISARFCKLGMNSFFPLYTYCGPFRNVGPGAVDSMCQVLFSSMNELAVGLGCYNQGVQSETTTHTHRFNAHFPRTPALCPRHTYRRQKLVLVSDSPVMQFGTEFFWYLFLVTNKTVLYFGVGFTSFWFGFSVPISDACVVGISQWFSTLQDNMDMLKRYF